MARSTGGGSAAAEPRRADGIELLFLYHLWACVPFALAWLVWTDQLGTVPADDPRTVHLKLVYAVGLPYLALRTWVTTRGRGRFRWERLWPFADVLLISAGLSAHGVQADSWAVLLYLLPVIETAATLDLRWSLGVGLVAAVGFVTASSPTQSDWYGTAVGQFRPFFLLLTASLSCQLGREIARTRRELALAEYRNELAAEMHDGIQSYLVAITMRLELARSLIASDPQRAAELAADQQYLVRQAADELRVVVRRLRSPSLGEAALPEVIRQYVDLFGQREALSIEVDCAGTPRRLPPRIEQAALRIVQEALTNVVKHAAARRVEVFCDFTPAALEVRISDDGRGFDPSRPPADELSGIGTETMLRRAELVGGTCDISSSPGAGTTVTLRVPTPGGEP